jgi:hypothetical protein
MTYPININRIDISVEFSEEVIFLESEAKKYLLEHEWCEKVVEGWLFTNIGHVLCIFLYHIKNSQSPEDDLIWIMVGDFPPMYLDTFNINSTKEVVDVYIELSEEWISQAESGESIEDCYPLQASTDKESINLLKRKVARLKAEISQNIDDLRFDIVKKLNQ